jgi:hypothetical protein
MIVGHTLFTLDGGFYFSPEFPRGGLAARFAVDVTHLVLAGAMTFDIVVEHRNREDTSFTSAGSFSGITATGLATVDLSGLQEIVRFKYGFGGGTPAASDAVHFLMMAPSWRPY